MVMGAHAEAETALAALSVASGGVPRAPASHSLLAPLGLCRCAYCQALDEANRWYCEIHGHTSDSEHTWAICEVCDCWFLAKPERCDDLHDESVKFAIAKPMVEDIEQLGRHDVDWPEEPPTPDDLGDHD